MIFGEFFERNKYSPEGNAELPEGNFKIEGVPFYTQRLDEGNFKQEGFRSLEEAQYWSERICGLTCLKMVLSKFSPNQEVPLKQLLDRGFAIGAYREDIGWVHQGLVNLGKEFGIAGGRESVGQDVEKIAHHVIEGRLVIPSITVGFEAGKEYLQKDGSIYTMPRGGHLSVVFGVDVQNHQIKKFELHHPSSSQQYEWPNYSVDREKFAGSFSEKGNIMYFEKPKS